jgi:hypothetical protein
MKMEKSGSEWRDYLRISLLALKCPRWESPRLVVSPNYKNKIGRIEAAFDTYGDVEILQHNCMFSKEAAFFLEPEEAVGLAKWILATFGDASKEELRTSGRIYRVTGEREDHEHEKDVV